MEVARKEISRQRFRAFLNGFLLGSGTSLILYSSYFFWIVSWLVYTKVDWNPMFVSTFISSIGVTFIILSLFMEIFQRKRNFEKKLKSIYCRTFSLGG
ncbi:MAG: hypothetical protein DRN04_13030 [Thermoprotei archaeon]|nr:MAG: hypothetical protein DRN04_13030 [Thermoprotei archaeon]